MRCHDLRSRKFGRDLGGSGRVSGKLSRCLLSNERSYFNCWDDWVR